MNNIESELQKLDKLEKKIYSFQYATKIISIDGETVAPVESFEGRAEAISVLSSYLYDLTTCKDTIDFLLDLREQKEFLSEHQNREVELLLREYDYLKNIPSEKYVDYQKTICQADSSWKYAKENNDFSSFLPFLEKIFDYNREFAKYYKPNNDSYDTQLDLYEKGLNSKQCDEFFTLLKNKIVPLIKEISKKNQISNSALKFSVDKNTQIKITNFLMDYLNIDPKHCVCGETEHPFTENLTKKDVRITTHYYENDFTSSMYSVIHEGGHALYELNCDDEHDYTSVAGGTSMGIHESISRFYENIIGRNIDFIEGIYDKLVSLIPELKDISINNFYEMINRVEPSLIRTEADELTYPLHVIVRYEIEKNIFDGSLLVKDIPSYWNKLYYDYLGVNVPSDTAGCLQDSHWSGGNIGYFPSYSLGSAYGAQYLNLMKKDLDFSSICKSGNLKEINEWFRNRIFKYASMYDPKELFEKVCGKSFNPNYYIDYLTKKYSDLYKL